MNTTSLGLLDRLKRAKPDAAEWQRLQDIYLPLTVRRPWAKSKPVSKRGKRHARRACSGWPMWLIHNTNSVGKRHRAILGSPSHGGGW